MKSLFVLSDYAYDVIYSPEDRGRIGNLVDVYVPQRTKEQIVSEPEVLEPVDVIFSGWGAPKIDETFLAHAPNLKVIFYGAGSIRRFATDAMWERGIQVTTAAGVNAVPVAEYCLSQIFFCLKQGWQLVLDIRRTRKWPVRENKGSLLDHISGAYQATVGLVSLGAISLKLIELLKPFDLNILVCSDYLSPERAADLGVERCGLEELFQRSDVVSLHNPATPGNIGLITGAHIRSMKPYASLINSARGAVVRQQEMEEALWERPDLIAILDVTDPEPLPDGHSLFTLPNVILTPHIAGSIGRECYRMGKTMADELERYLAGKPLKYAVTQERASYSA